jgi:putative DNA primase/helicase
MMLNILDHALYYANLGAAVLPLNWPILDGESVKCSCGKAGCNSIGKHPFARFVPNGLKEASRDHETIRRWFTKSACNIGIVTGGISGFFALDVDPRHEGDESLCQLETTFGPLPHTARFLTGGGGEHILFRHPGKPVPNSAGKIGKGLDIKGDDGYIVAPPSRHPSGRPYAISADHHPDDVPLAAAPAWLLERIAGKKSPEQIAQGWREMVMRAVPEGERNVAIAKLSGLLLAKRIDPYVTLDLMLGFNRSHCNPPLADKEVAVVVANIARRETDRRTKNRAKAGVNG